MNKEKYCDNCKETTPHIEHLSCGEQVLNIFTIGLSSVCNGDTYQCLRCEKKRNEYN